LKKGIPYIAYIFVFLLIHSNLSAQKQKPKNESWYDEKIIHFGFSLGLNTMDFNITPSQEYLRHDSLYADVSKLAPGINIQIVTDFKPANHMDIRFLPGVSFGQRTIRYYKDQVLYNGGQKLESSFLEFPLLLKLKGDRLNNVRPYVIGGINYRYDLAAKKEFDPAKQVYVRIKKPDLYYEVGAGLDFYLSYFKLSVELKMSQGLNDVLVKDYTSRHPEYTHAIEKMRSQIWILAFHFE
jgi:hypothetical protein